MTHSLERKRICHASPPTSTADPLDTLWYRGPLKWPASTSDNLFQSPNYYCNCIKARKNCISKVLVECVLIFCRKTCVWRRISSSRKACCSVVRYQKICSHQLLRLSSDRSCRSRHSNGNRGYRVQKGWAEKRMGVTLRSTFSCKIRHRKWEFGIFYIQKWNDSNTAFSVYYTSELAPDTELYNSAIS